MLSVEHGHFLSPSSLLFFYQLRKVGKKINLKDLVNAMCDIRNCLNNEKRDQTNQVGWQCCVQVVHAQHTQPLKKELITIREIRKELCLSLAPELCFDGLCCGQSQFTFVLQTLISAEIANSLLSGYSHRKASVSSISSPLHSALLCLLCSFASNLAAQPSDIDTGCSQN